MPKACKIYYGACGKIDHHNRLREMTGVDRCFRTNDWATHVNLGIMSMMFVDSYLLYKTSRGDSYTRTPREFFELLACDLIDQNTPQASNQGTPTQSRVQN